MPQGSKAAGAAAADARVSGLAAGAAGAAARRPVCSIGNSGCIKEDKEEEQEEEDVPSSAAVATSKMPLTLSEV